MTTQGNLLRGLLTKRPFYRTSPQSLGISGQEITNTAESSVTADKVIRTIVTQADFIRELDTDSHAINNKELYKSYMQKDEDGLYYEVDIPRYAFPFQQEILDDRLARLTGNDIQFDLADIDKGEKGYETYDRFKAGWADKGMERAWHYLAKSVLSTGDGAFVGILDNGKFYWKVFSFADGDVLYPHYNRMTGRMDVFARLYQNYDDTGITHNYIDVWDDSHYFRFVDKSLGSEENGEQKTQKVGEFNVDGYELEFTKPHGFDRIPVAYKRNDSGPCWSQVQELIEHYEQSMSRLAQSNAAFGLPLMFLKGDGKEMEEIATSDMSYAAKILLIPADGEAGFLQRQDASNAYKAELDELRKKIYEGAMVVKAPELKSGDTPAAAIKLLYSDSYNKALLESQEYDEVMHDMVEIFEWGYGIESEHRLDFTNTRIVYYIRPFIPINDSEVCQNLSLAVQNGFCSKQTASEKFYHSTPNEWDRILKEKHDDDMHTLLIEEQRLEMQNDANVDMQEELADIQTENQIQVIKAQNSETKSDDEKSKKNKVRTKRGSLNTGRSPGRPNMTGRKWDENGNYEGRNGWRKWDATH
jgi:hypothetical protein